MLRKLLVNFDTEGKFASVWDLLCLKLQDENSPCDVQWALLILRYIECAYIYKSFVFRICTNENMIKFIFLESNVYDFVCLELLLELLNFVFVNILERSRAKLWTFASELTNFSPLLWHSREFAFDHGNHDFRYNKIIGLLIILFLQDQKQNVGSRIETAIKRVLHALLDLTSSIQ